MKTNSFVRFFNLFAMPATHAIFWCWITVFSTVCLLAAADNPNPPSSPVKLIFIHHSTGGNWLADANDSFYGELGKALMNNNYYASATNYGWGPDSIGNRTDIVNWPEWFTGANTTNIMTALYAETGQNIQDFGAWTRMTTDPGGLNQIVLFKSCFPNSNLTGNPTDPARTEPNDDYSVANAKAVYNRLLTYFATRQDKLFVVITAPPLNESEYPENTQTPAARAANARAFNNWLVNNWLTGYSHSNVAVFDYYNVLTSNGGSANVNDIGSNTGNHHRWWNGAVQHVQSVNNNFPAYPSGDSHPSSAGHLKATAEFLPLLNVFYHRWQSGSNNPILAVSPTSKSVSKEAGTFLINISNIGTGSMLWTASVTSGGNWLSINSGASGTNSGTIACAIVSNTTLSSRTGTIRITASGATGSPKDVTVTQAGTATATLSPVPDTGQSKCYDVAGAQITCPSPGQSLYGQDANYSINPMSYTKLDGNGNALPDSATSWVTVRDNITGLSWEMKSNYNGVENYDDIHDADNRYAWYDSNPATNGGNAGNPNDGKNTEAFIQAMNAAHYGGYSDWRLPTFKELTSIVNFGASSPPTLVTQYFPNSYYGGFHWSSTTHADYPEAAWGVHFWYGGYEKMHDKWYPDYVRAVRGNKVALANDSAVGSDIAAAGIFRESGDSSTITDLTTGLVWQQAGPSTLMSWAQALAYCEGLNLGGYTDWRLPTIKELRRLADYSRVNPSIDTTLFPNTFPTVYWSSTTYENSPNGAWGVDFYNGHDDSYDKDEINRYVRAVRGGDPGALSQLAVSPASRPVTNTAGTTTFTVSNAGSGNMPWTAAVTSSGGWLRITSGASGTNTGTISCTFDANLAAAARTGVVRITANGAIGSPIDVTVIQSSTPTPSPTPTSTPRPTPTPTATPKPTPTLTPKPTPTPTTTPKPTPTSTPRPTPTPVPVKSQILGAWPDGVWAWSKTLNRWTQMSSTANALMIASGKVDTDGVDDLIGVWSSGLYVRLSGNWQWMKLSTLLPIWIAAGDLNNDGRDDVIGSWKNDGVYYRDSASGKWWKISSAARQLAAGNIGGIRDDLAGVWNDGLWVRYSAAGTWQKIDPVLPVWIAVGDMSGDKRADIICSYASGTWYRHSVSQSWTRITTPAEQIASGDIDGDGRDDLIGVWSDGVYVRYGATGLWQKVATSKPKWIAAGRILETISSVGVLDDPMISGQDILDLSDATPDAVLE